MKSVLTGVHHIGIAVDDIDAADAVLRDQLQLPLIRRHRAPDDSVEVAFYHAGNVELELVWQRDSIASSTPGSARQARIEHIAMTVADLNTALAALEALGVQFEGVQEGLLGQSARTVPETSGGVVYQVLQLK